MYIKKRTRFDRLVRISQEQLEWLKKVKDTKTVAGFLDRIINDYKKNGK